MCRQINEKLANFSSILEPSTRNYRQVMKPRLPRKLTASGRINLNRFWNELEEFYNRYDARTEKPVVKMPDYTTDTFDHHREEAENELNEVMETKVLSRQRLHSDDISEDNSSVDEGHFSEQEFSEANDEVFLWNVHEKSMPRPPRTLLDLIHRLSM